MNTTLFAVLAGALAGYAYYRLVGCATGACPLTSNPYTSALYGAVMGLVIAGWTPRAQEPAGFQRLEPAAAADLASRPGTFVLDVRTRAEFETGRLPGAVLIPLDELPRRLSELPRDKSAPVLVYCATGRRSRTAGSLLAGQGRAAVHDLKGGIAAWRAAGLPVAR